MTSAQQKHYHHEQEQHGLDGSHQLNDSDTANSGAHSKHIQNTSSKIGPWKMGKTLGFGSTGRVRMAINEKTNQHAAVKIVSKSLFTKSQNNTSTIVEDQDNDFLPYGIEREIIIMKLLNHPNVLRLYDVWETDTDLYMVLEYVERGELFNLLVERGPLGEKEAVRFFRQIIIGISYCHALGIVHRDLKPENLLLDHKLNIKIADFGMAALETKDKLLETSCGSPHYAAPEIVSGMPYHGFESDVWSCGVILYALLTGRLPFDEEDGNIRKLLLKVQKGKFVMPTNISPDARDLLSKILTVDPETRIGTREILKHPLLKKYPNIKDSKSIRNLPREDTYLNPLANGGSDNIDQSILNNLVILWHGKNKEDIIKSLKDPGANLEKTFYALLYNFKINVQLQNQLHAPHSTTSTNQTQKQQHTNVQDFSSRNKTPSPQKQKRMSVYQQQSNNTPSPQKNIVSSTSASSNSKKRLSTISVSSSHRRPISFIKPNGSSSSSTGNTVSNISNVSSHSGHSLGSTPVKRTVTTSSHSASSSMDSAPPVPHDLLHEYSSSTPNTSMDEANLADVSTDDSRDNLSQETVRADHEYRVSTSSPPSAPAPSAVHNPKRISRTISKRFSTSGSRASFYGGTGTNGNYGTLINSQTKLKRGSITTNLIATYAKLSELQDEEGAYIEQETRRTSQTFATLIDEVFEYEKHEQIRREKLDLERKLRESKLKEEQEKLQKERELLDKEKKQLRLQEEQDRLKKKKQLSQEKLLKMEKKKKELEKMIAQLKKGLGDSDAESLEEVSDDEFDTETVQEDAHKKKNVSDIPSDVEIGEGEDEEGDEENKESSPFEIEDYQDDQLLDSDSQTQEANHSNSELENDASEDNKNNFRSISEPMPSSKLNGAIESSKSNRNSIIDNDMWQSTQKRSFSLSTRPVSRLDPGLTPYEEYRTRKNSSNRNSRFNVRKSTFSTLDEKEVEVSSKSENEHNDYSSEEEEEFDYDEDEGYTTIIDEEEVERRIVESLRRSKFLGSQFDLAMKLAGGQNVNANKRKSILKPNHRNSQNVVPGGHSTTRSSKNKHAKAAKSKRHQSFNNHKGMLSTSLSMRDISTSTDGNIDGEHKRLADVNIPEFTRESGALDNSKKRLSVLSMYSTKQSFRDLAAELKKDASHSEEERLFGKENKDLKSDDDEDKFLFEEDMVNEAMTTTNDKDGENADIESQDKGVSSNSSQVKLNFADRFKKSKKNKSKNSEKDTKNQEPDASKKQSSSSLGKNNVVLPELPPLDKSNTNTTTIINGLGLGIVKDSSSSSFSKNEKKTGEENESIQKDIESVSANVTEPLNIKKQTKKTLGKPELLEEKKNDNKSIPKKKSGIFRLFSLPVSEPSAPAPACASTPASAAFSTPASSATKKQTSNSVIHYEGSFVKIICDNRNYHKNGKSQGPLDQLKLLTILYDQLIKWERSKIGLKNVTMDSRQYLIRGKISSDNILSLRSTSFQILCSVDSESSSSSSAKNNIILINKLSGSKKTFAKFIAEFERFLRKQEIIV